MTVVQHPAMKKLFDSLFAPFFSGDEVQHPFWLLCWEKNTGKTTFLLDYISRLLGWYISSDFLHIKDFSSLIGKEHSLKIEMKKNELSGELASTYGYNDRGVREIKERFSRSPLGQYKVILLENIERMTTSAANALLKTIEEPGEWRLVIATTSSLSSLLATIASRALVINYISPSAANIKNHIETTYPGLSFEDLALTVKLSHWRIGFAITMAQLIHSETDHVLLSSWKKFLALRSDATLVSVNQFLVESHKLWVLQDLLTLLHYEALDKNLFSLNRDIVQTKQYLANNVSTDGTLLKLSHGLMAMFGWK